MAFTEVAGGGGGRGGWAGAVSQLAFQKHDYARLLRAGGKLSL